jgi:molybdate transport system substrate-binding protein
MPRRRLLSDIGEDIMMGNTSSRPRFRATLLALIGGVSLWLSAGAALAESASVAVAANFTEAAKEIGALFEKETGDRVIFSFGSTGQLYAQITQGAPFDVLVSADDERTKTAIKEGNGVAGTDFTYAVGKLVLFSTDAKLVSGAATLKKGAFEKIAIANPVIAPYGAAAVETMKALGVYDALSAKIVQGQNITQTYQFVATGNAQLGFVALAQLAGKNAGSRWVVPEKLHPPIAQDAVLTQHGASNKAARAFLSFLKGPKAKAVIEKFGYGAGAK